VLISEDLKRDTRELYQSLLDASIERLFLPFIALQLLADVAIDQGPMALSLQEIITAGEQLQITPQIAELFKGLKGCTLSNQYGPTESHVVTAFGLKDPPDDWPLLPSIGRPISNSKIYLLDINMQPLPVGASGELYIGGVCLARGYFNQPELTAEKFIPNPFSQKPGEVLYKTGDLARYLPDGRIEFLGRIDHQVKIRGFRIELGEVESVLGRHPTISDTVVIAREDVPGDKRLVAYVVASRESTPTFSELRSFLKEKLPEYMIPSAFVFLDSFPLTPNGKVDRQALPAPDVARPELQEAFVAPRNQSEEMVAGIWSNVLGVERIGVYDSFFELGGHSLLVVQIISRIREVFAVDLPVRSLFETPTIAGLTELIETARLKKLGPRYSRETTTSDWEEGKI
jgi:acyl-coenzyme A synthetase/AMP-(fatty) acid ligase/acyl carrier protein